MFLRNASSLLLSFVSVALYVRALDTQPVQIASVLGDLFGNCLAATEDVDGAAVIIEACSPTTAFNSWVVPNGVVGEVGTIQIFGDKCLDVTNGADVDGTKLQIWTCATGNTNQMWVPAGPDAGIAWSGQNKCVDVTNGNLTRGNQVQLWDCVTDNDNQRYNFLSVTQPESRTIFLADDTDLCVTASANVTGAPVIIADCDGGAGAAAQAWSDPLGKGQLAAFGGDLCITPLNDVINDGTKLVLEPCQANKADQVWGFGDRAVNLAEANAKICLDLTNGNKTTGNQLQIWTCAAFTGTTDNTNQDWNEIIF